MSCICIKEVRNFTIINAIDMGEGLHVVHDFEIQIYITDYLDETD